MFLDTIKNGKMVDKSIITNIWECLEKISNENVQCCICGVSLPRNFQNKIENTVILEEHLLKIHNIQSFESCGLAEKFECSECHFSAPKESHLKSHIKTKHPKPKVLKSFIWNHISRLSSDNAKCNYCGKIYIISPKTSSTSSIRKHLLQKHIKELSEMDVQQTKQDLATCQFCDKEFHYNAKVKRKAHEIMYHTKDYKYICKHCGKGFASQSDHAVHERRHTGFKPHHCKFCEKSFTTSTQLKQHSRVHTGETPFQCSKCKKFFKFHSTRNNHNCILKK